ncbi:MAG: sulfatase-like hydrolase/transferase, partial [Kiritimatiellaeota bacterium]|nr:sulfatase-like hydrolase/transferase [Kiritimatiellota bacterium]
GSLEANNGHLFNGVLHGTKGSCFEGGTRLPFITRWPGHVRSGVSDELICQVDMLASFAALTGQSLAPADGPDSLNVLPALLGERCDKPCREYLVEQNNDASWVGLRKGPWKLLPPVNERNVRGERLKPEVEHPAEAVAKRDYPANKIRLYNLTNDLSETKDIAAAHPDIVAEMSAKLAEIMKGGKKKEASKTK